MHQLIHKVKLATLILALVVVFIAGCAPHGVATGQRQSLLLLGSLIKPSILVGGRFLTKASIQSWLDAAVVKRFIKASWMSNGYAKAPFGLTTGFNLAR